MSPSFGSVFTSSTGSSSVSILASSLTLCVTCLLISMYDILLFSCAHPRTETRRRYAESVCVRVVHDSLFDQLPALNNRENMGPVVR